MPTFTLIDHSDEIKQVRLNLYSLLSPIQDRKKAVKEYVEVGLSWNLLQPKPYPEKVFESYELKNRVKPPIEETVEQYT